MKKVVTLLAVLSIFSLTAFGQTEEETPATEVDGTEMLESVENEIQEFSGEELAEHVCDVKCEENGCTGPRCGEKGHVCTVACHTDKLKDHVCDATCEAVGCKGARCGEKGHMCTAACHAKKKTGTTID